MMGLLPRIGEHPGFTLCRASVALVGLLFVLAVVGLRGTFAWVGVLAVLAWCVTWTHPWTAAAAGAEGWALETGFGVNGHAELTFHPSDLRHLAIVVAFAVIAAVLTRRLSPESSRGREGVTRS
jgi:hypothetical protein